MQVLSENGVRLEPCVPPIRPTSMAMANFANPVAPCSASHHNNGCHGSFDSHCTTTGDGDVRWVGTRCLVDKQRVGGNPAAGHSESDPENCAHHRAVWSKFWPPRGAHRTRISQWHLRKLGRAWYCRPLQYVGKSVLPGVQGMGDWVSNARRLRI